MILEINFPYFSEGISEDVLVLPLELKPSLLLGNVNRSSKKWRMKNYDYKEIATTWRAGITKAGLKMKDMGITWS